MKTLRLAVIALAFTAIQSWASTTTPRLGMTIPAYGDQNWDVQLRSNFNIIDSSVAVSTNTAVLTSTQAFTGTNTFAKIIFDQNGTSNGSGIYFTSSAGTPYSSLSRGASLGIQDLRINPVDGLGIGTNNPYSGSGLQGQPYFIVGSPGGNFGTYGRFAVLGSSADSTVTYSGFTSTNSVNTSTLWVLPRNDGTANQPLATDGAANLSFASSLTLSSFTVTTSTSTRFNATVSSITTLATQNFTVNTATVSTSLAMNGKRITNIGNGTASTDAAAFGQIPTHADPATYTPTVVGAGTVSTTNMFWTQDGKVIHIWGTFLTGTVAASAASITVPSGKTIDTTKVVNGSPLGDCYDMETGSVQAAVHSLAFSDASDTSKIFFSKAFTTGSLLSGNLGNAIWGTGAYIYVNLWVPVTS